MQNVHQVPQELLITTKQKTECLAQGHNIVPLVRLEPAIPPTYVP